MAKFKVQNIYIIMTSYENIKKGQVLISKYIYGTLNLHSQMAKKKIQILIIIYKILFQILWPNH